MAQLSNIKQTGISQNCYKCVRPNLFFKKIAAFLDLAHRDQFARSSTRLDTCKIHAV